MGEIMAQPVQDKGCPETLEEQTARIMEGPVITAGRLEPLPVQEDRSWEIVQIEAWIARPCECGYTGRPGLCRRCKITELWLELKEALNA
jgi:hypothetical protein